MAAKPIIDVEAVEVSQGKPVAMVPMNPDRLLEMAVTKGVPIEQMTQLLDLRDRWEANEARKAYVTAMNAFKADPPTITKNKTVAFGQGDRATSYNHATLDHVCDAVTNALSKHGISHRWKIDQDGAGIKVSCILTHELGHSEETMLVGAPDTSGSKNSIQAIGSTVTYLQRYTLLAACGLAASNADNDGVAASNGAVAERIEWIENCRDVPELRKIYADAYTKFEENPAAIKALIAAKNARLQELS